MNKQLYIIQVDNAKLYPQYAEQYLQSGQFSIHSGGRGNGAVGGLYTEKQLKRIIGRYPEGVAKAIPVATGYTQGDVELLEDNSEWLGYLEAAGVDNWEGIDYARELRSEQEGGNDAED